MSDQSRRRFVMRLYGLLAVPAFALAMLSVFVLDAPWAARGWGALAAWFAILACFAMAFSFLVAVAAVERWNYPVARAARIPLVALPAFLVALLLLLAA